MTLVEQIRVYLEQLPPDKQDEVLDFVLFLKQRAAAEQTVSTSPSCRLQTILESLTRLGVFDDIPDPVAWQRQLRQDCSLPGRI